MRGMARQDGERDTAGAGGAFRDGYVADGELRQRIVVGDGPCCLGLRQRRIRRRGQREREDLVQLAAVSPATWTGTVTLTIPGVNVAVPLVATKSVPELADPGTVAYETETVSALADDNCSVKTALVATDIAFGDLHVAK